MAKTFRIVKLVSEEGTGDYYTTTKPTKGPKTADKLRFKKYDKKLRRHVWFKEVRKLK
jgi:large subunit ribosomal protein L33|tara:strand:+ start:342 stop:515 length:174 start_codon:yes stop_codon:yes gene_type:complete